MSSIGIGMGKAEVIEKLGEPKKGVGGRNNIEVFHYAEDKGWWRFDYYFVRFVDGKVESYGLERDSGAVTESDPPLKSTK